jgi:homoserine acetyltransferase
MLPTRPDVEVIASVDGHDAFLTETEAVGKFVRGALMG